MNWTGGRLKRYSKANANGQIRAQKQHFAKARLQTQSGCAPPTPKFSILRHLQSDTTLRVSHPEDNPQRSNLKHLEKPSITIKHPDPIDRTPIDKERTRTALRLADRPERDANPVDHIKRDLLAQSDWVGLTKTRPANPSIARQQEVGNIGRRRRMAIPPRERWLSASASRKNLLGTELRQKAQKERLIPDNRTEDCSVRIGSNIHQTQPSQTHASQDPPQSILRGPPEDVVVPESCRIARRQVGPKEKSFDGLSRISTSGIPSVDTEQPGEAAMVNPPLIPLNEVLDLASFDEVLERSSSRLQTPLSISPENLLPVLHHNSTERFQRYLHSVRVRSRDKISDRESSASLPMKITRHHVQQVTATSFDKTNSHSVSPLQQRCLSPERNVDQEAQDENSFNDETERARRFTLEEQVDLEQSLKRDRAGDRQPSDLATCVSIHTNFLHDSDIQSRGSPRIYACGGQHDAIIHTLSPNEQPAPDHRLPGQFEKQATHEYSFYDDLLPPNGAKFHESFMDDDNDTWMKFVFPEDLSCLQDGFSFDVPPAVHQRSDTNATELSSTRSVPRPIDPASRERHSSSSLISGVDNCETVPSAVNATIFAPSSHQQYSETDFLTQLSPMEGYFDERLAGISMHNNAAATEWKFGQVQSKMKPQATSSRCNLSLATCTSTLPSKRKASDIDDTICLSESDTASAPTMQGFMPVMHSDKTDLWLAKTDKAGSGGDMGAQALDEDSSGYDPEVCRFDTIITKERAERGRFQAGNEGRALLREINPKTKRRGNASTRGDASSGHQSPYSPFYTAPQRVLNNMPVDKAGIWSESSSCESNSTG